jgi:hypothetical protein
MVAKIHLLMKGYCMEHNRNSGYNTKLQILIQLSIGLDSDVRHPVVEILNNQFKVKARKGIKNE